MARSKYTRKQLTEILNEAADLYEAPSFIDDDPICVPHQFTKQQDIEIAGLFASLLAWGQRPVIIRNAKRLMEMMDHAPHDWIINHTDDDLSEMQTFVHRTFQAVDLIGILAFLQQHYKQHESLESAFIGNEPTVESGLRAFHNRVMSCEDVQQRTAKHISTPERKSACKRLNLYLRWMVRPSTKGVDFGIWSTIKPSQLIMPLDVHVARIAEELGILKRTQRDWRAAFELTEALRTFDPSDPVKYDYALFGIGVLDTLKLKS